MTTQTQAKQDQVVYPDSDGMPMADNTLQYEWLTTIKGNLDVVFRDAPDVFVAGDLLWYPVQGRPDVRAAPDVLVAFGRPRGYRGSYLQWREGGVAPQVVIEILSPGNRPEAMDRKWEFYDLYGVEEYYLYDPAAPELAGWRRQGIRLEPIPAMNGWVSPRLGIRFDVSGEELALYRPDGTRFRTVLELDQEAREAVRRADEERRRADEAARRANEEHERAERLAAMLRALGVDPDKPPA